VLLDFGNLLSEGKHFAAYSFEGGPTLLNRLGYSPLLLSMGCSRKVLLICTQRALNMLNVSDESKNVHCTSKPFVETRIKLPTKCVLHVPLHRTESMRQTLPGQSNLSRHNETHGKKMCGFPRLLDQVVLM
jgi:hypothetical protein